MQEEFRTEICKQIDSKIVSTERSSTPGVGGQTKARLPDYMDGEYSKVPDTRKSGTQTSVMKGETLGNFVFIDLWNIASNGGTFVVE